MEFLQRSPLVGKLDETSENAIEQIKDRAYIASYKNASKKIILVGVSFSKKERNIDTFKSEEWKRG